MTPRHGPGSCRPSVTASRPASSRSQKADKSGATGNRQAIPATAMCGAEGVASEGAVPDPLGGARSGEE